jgi:hypothetical protein
MEENSFMASQDKDRDEDKQSSELLRRSLAGPAGAPGSEIGACPDPEILAAYSERSLDPEEATRWNMHFSQCARCREQLVVLVRARDSAGTTEEKRPRAPSLVWDWRWLAPAAAAIILVVVVLVFRPPHRAAEQQIVAMNQSAEPPTSSATPESAPNSSPASDSLARTSPNSNSAKSEIEPSAKASRPSRDDRKEFAANSPADDGEFGPLQPMKHVPAPPKAEASSRSGIGHGSGNAIGSGVGNGSGIAPAPPGATQTVTVESAVSPVTPAAPVPAVAAPPEKESAQPNGAASADAIATKKSTNGQQLSVGVANRNLTQNEMVVVEAVDATSARTLVHTPDPQVLWRFSSGRFVERSSDAGTTWHAQWTNPNAHLVAGVAPTADTCWLVGRAGLVIVTVNGKKWKTIAPPAETDFVDVTATDASEATVTTSDDRKFTTSDGGKHWTLAP